MHLPESHSDMRSIKIALRAILALLPSQLVCAQDLANRIGYVAQARGPSVPKIAIMEELSDPKVPKDWGSPSVLPRWFCSPPAATATGK
jgi:hypothetical protein